MSKIILEQYSLTFVKVPLTPKNFYLLQKSASFPDFISEKIILIDKILPTGVWTCNFYVHDRAKWDLGRAASDVTSGTELKHSRDFWLSLEGCQTFLGYLWFIFYRNWTRFLRERTVSSSITIWSLAGLVHAAGIHSLKSHIIWLPWTCLKLDHVDIWQEVDVCEYLPIEKVYVCL